MEEGFIKCPFCANDIKEGAIKCQYCGEFLNRGKKQNEAAYSDEGKEKKSNNVIIRIILGIIVLLGLIVMFIFINRPKPTPNISDSTQKESLKEDSTPIISNDGTKVGDDNILAFLMDTEELYCDIYTLIQGVITGPKEERYKALSVGSDDVPAQRVLAERLLNTVEIRGTETKMENYFNKRYDSEFSDTVRLMNTSLNYLLTYLNKDKYLQNFEQFKTIFTTDFSASNDALNSIPGTLLREYSRYRSDLPESQRPIGEKNMLNINEICEFSIAVVN